MVEGYVPVPYDEFVEMLTAKIKLKAIKEMLESTDEYCSHGIMVTLGLVKYERSDSESSGRNDGTD